MSLKSCAIRACRGARQTPQSVLWKHLHSPWNAGDQRKHLQNAQQVRQSVQRHNKGIFGCRHQTYACCLYVAIVLCICFPCRALVVFGLAASVDCECFHKGKGDASRPEMNMRSPAAGRRPWNFGHKDERPHVIYPANHSSFQ